jgi:hypothetical protein
VARRLVNLAKPAVFPFARMLGHSGAHHVQIDIDNALMQMIIGLDSRNVIPVLPETRRGGSCADCILAPSTRRSTACSGHDIPACVFHQEMYAVRRHSTTCRTHVRAVTKLRGPLTAPLRTEIQDMPNGRQQIDTALFDVARQTIRRAEQFAQTDGADRRVPASRFAEPSSNA